MPVERGLTLPQKQEKLFLNPSQNIQEAYKRVYQQGDYEIGWPNREKRLYEDFALPNTAGVVGGQNGDEGKARIVDNKVSSMHENPSIRTIYIDRPQGGNNAGHTVKHGETTLYYHSTPSIGGYERTVGIMDNEMVIHAEDTETEITELEGKVGDLRGRYVLANMAHVGTDICRAREELVNHIAGGKLGGTGMGIGIVYGDALHKRGFIIDDLMDPHYKEAFGNYYDEYAGIFAQYDLELASMQVPDFKNTQLTGKKVTRPVGTKAEFLDRIKNAREWIKKRDMVRNTFGLHLDIMQDNQSAIIFEGAQAVGLDKAIGRRPDVTGSNTTLHVIQESSNPWLLRQIADRAAVIKIPYTSSVGKVHMPTDTGLPREITTFRQLPENAPWEWRWALRMRRQGKEYGVTTKRARDIDFIDLDQLRFNMRMSGAEVMVLTHGDMARVRDRIKVATHYVDTQEEDVTHYKPGLRNLKHAIPQYVELPGWDGTKARTAHTLDELPQNLHHFMGFMQETTGYPIVAITTGPDRENLITFPGYNPQTP